LIYLNHSLPPFPQLNMTRTNKANDPPHNNPEVAATMQENALPRFYGKNASIDTAPGKTKKDGGGKGNWGQPGDEIEDMHEYNITKPRRRSNSQSNPLDLKTKFEINEADPVFEEELHGAPAKTDKDEDGEALSTSSTNESHAESTEPNGTSGGPFST